MRPLLGRIINAILLHKCCQVPPPSRNLNTTGALPLVANSQSQSTIAALLLSKGSPTRMAYRLCLSAPTTPNCFLFNAIATVSALKHTKTIIPIEYSDIFTFKQVKTIKLYLLSFDHPIKFLDDISSYN